jgi:glycosyl transferase family 25
MGWIDSSSHARLRSFITPYSTFRQLPSTRIGIFSVWIFVSVLILLTFLHPLSPVQSGYYGSTLRAVKKLENHIGNSTLGVLDFKLYLDKPHAYNRLQFEKIFIINLKSRTDRRDRMLLGATMSGLDVELFDAVTEVSEKAMPPGAPTHWPKGIKGCWRSHMDILEKYIFTHCSSLETSTNTTLPGL